MTEHWETSETEKIERLERELAEVTREAEHRLVVLGQYQAEIKMLERLYAGLPKAWRRDKDGTWWQDVALVPGDEVWLLVEPEDSDTPLGLAVEAVSDSGAVTVTDGAEWSFNVWPDQLYQSQSDAQSARAEAGEQEVTHEP